MTVDNIVAGQSGLTALTNLNLIIDSVNGFTDNTGSFLVVNSALEGGDESFAAIKAYTNSTGSSFYGESLTSTVGSFSQTGVSPGGTQEANLFLLNRNQSGESNLSGNIIMIIDNPTTSGTISGKILSAEIGVTERISLNPRVPDGATAVAYFEDTHNDLTTAGAKLHSFRNQGTEKVFIDKDGVIEITEVGQGVILASPDGTRYKLTVSNAGALVITAV